MYIKQKSINESHSIYQKSIFYKTYNLNKDETTWYCISYSKDLFPFSSLTDNDFHTTIQVKK